MFVNSVSPKTILFLFTLVLFGLTSCDDQSNCPYEDGTIVPIQENLLPWLGDLNASQAINFISETGAEKTVDLAYQSTQEEWYDCADVLHDQIKQTFYFAEGDSLRVIASAGTLNFYADSDSLDVDFSGALLSSDITYQETELVNSIGIHEQTFEEVLVVKDYSSSNMNQFDYFVFNKEKGLLSFTYKGEIWLRE